MKNRILICFCIFSVCLSLPSYSQYSVSKVNKKAIESYTRAMEKVQNDDYKGAIPIFQEAIQKDPNYVDAYLSLAGVYGQIKNYQQSVDTYEKAFALDSNYTSFYRLSYSINLAGLGQFEKDISILLYTNELLIGTAATVRRDRNI